jgi:hypothetical protein
VLKWLTTNAVVISVFTAALSLLTALDAHKEATHSEENTSAQIQLKSGEFLTFSGPVLLAGVTSRNGNFCTLRLQEAAD